MTDDRNAALKGNQNATKQPHERRINFTVSISGQRLAHLKKYWMALNCTDEEPTPQEIARFMRQTVDEQIDNFTI